MNAVNNKNALQKKDFFNIKFPGDYLILEDYKILAYRYVQVPKS